MLIIKFTQNFFANKIQKQEEDYKGKYLDGLVLSDLVGNYGGVCQKKNINLRKLIFENHFIFHILINIIYSEPLISLIKLYMIPCSKYFLY